MLCDKVKAIEWLDQQQNLREVKIHAARETFQGEKWLPVKS